MEPSIPDGVVCPEPVASRAAKAPRPAGLGAELQQPFSFNIAAWPWPVESRVNNAGALGTTVSSTAGERTPLVLRDHLRGLPASYRVGDNGGHLPGHGIDHRRRDAIEPHARFAEQ